MKQLIIIIISLFLMQDLLAQCIMRDGACAGNHIAYVGEQVTYTASPDVFAPTWTIANGTISGFGQTISVAWSSTGVLTLKSGGVIMDEIMVSVAPPIPYPQAPAVANEERCGIGTVTFTVSPGSGETTTITSYKWYLPNGSPATGYAGNQYTTNILDYSSGDGGTYSVAAVNSKGEGPRTYVEAIIKQVPTIVIQNNTPVRCSGEGTAISFSVGNGVGGTTFSWTVSAPDVTGASAGSGTSISQALSHPYATAKVVTYTVTPLANGCPGNTGSTNVTVNPLPIAAVPSKPICSGQSSGIGITNANNVPNTTFSWQVSAPEISGASAGGGNAIDQVLTNNTSFSQNAVYTVTPVANGCPGSPVISTVTVKPLPTANASNGLICSQESPNISITNGNNVSGTTFSWTVSAPNISGASADSRPTINQTLTNNTNTNQQATYTITPTANGCPGPSKNVIVTVKPKPTVSAQGQSLCSEESTNITISNTNNVPGTTFSWTASSSAVTGASAGTGSAINQTLTNITSANGTVTYTITGSANNCTSLPVTPIVTVKPRPQASASPQSIFSGATTSIPLQDSKGIPGTTFSWTVSASEVTGAAAGSGQTIGQTLEHSTSSNKTASYTISCIANGCPGTGTSSVVTVLPRPVIISPQNIVVKGLSVPLTTAVFSTYTWKDAGQNTVSTGQTFNVASLGTYTVTVTQQGVFGSGVSLPYTMNSQFSGQNMNYVVTNTVQVPNITDALAVPAMPVANVNQSIAYFDGLSRPLQTVVTQGSPSKKDIVQLVTYDDQGRTPISYMPFTDQATGHYKPTNTIIGNSGSYIGNAQAFYAENSDNKIADDTRPFTENIFEASPLNRPVKTYGPGERWHDDNKYAGQQYQINVHNVSSARHEQIIAWQIEASGLPARCAPLADYIETNGYYSTGQLHIRSTKDEHGAEVREYSDKEGKTILKKVMVSGSAALTDEDQWAQTYYLYDDRGNLRFVFPPELTRIITQTSNHTPTTTELNTWAFQYKYDGRNRMIEKQVPGAEPVYMIYDDRNRLVMIQDGNQRENFSPNQWTFTKYDALNRPVLTGTYENDSEPDDLQDDVNEFYSTLPAGAAWFETYIGSASGNVLGYDNQSFPRVAVENDYLTANFYDQYDAFIAPTGINGYRPKPHGLPGEKTATISGKTGQVTATLVKNLETGAWMRSVNYYDDEYRSIQSVSDHQKGKVRTGNVYDFTGRLLFTQSKYEVDGDTTTIKKSYTYDHAGRQLTEKHSINGATDLVLSANEYNELGQLVTKKLHRTLNGSYVTADFAIGQPGVVYGNYIDLDTYNSAQHTQIATNRIRLRNGFKVLNQNVFKARIGYSQQDADAHNNAIQENFLQEVDYRYNIRGWLDKINDPTAPISDDLFNMELRYHSPSINGGAAQYNGNISEAVWKSAGMDKQSYGYHYDNMNRLTEARYFNISQPDNNRRYDEKIGVNSSRPAYDLNGNILNLLRYGKTGESTYGVMDNLRYNYTNSGNKLLYVSDSLPTNTLEEGFKEITAGEGTTDYAYDANGNMTKDENKGITNIKYNHLNLPSKVYKSGADSIVYTYDATGRKLSQEVFGTTAKTTDYIGELVFEDNDLQFALHSEGRVIPDNTTGDPWEYQYFMKDHLGNTRVVLSEKTQTTEYKATMEDNTQSNEMADFRNYNSGVRSAMPLFDHTDDGSTYTYSQLLNGGNGSQVGLAKSFEVNPGDVFDMEVYAKYEAPGETQNTVSALLSQLVSAFSLGAGTTPLDGSLAQSKFNDLFSAGPWITSSKWDDEAPKAYLNYILFDENFTFQDFGFDQVLEGEQSGATSSLHDYLYLHVKVKRKGYLYIYLSNEQPTVTNVYFDDMKIVRHTAVQQVSDYYPFGLTFNVYSSENSVDQNYLYNGKELQDELNLNWLDYGARVYMPDLGRFATKDPLSESQLDFSPFHYTLNSPVNYSDPSGMSPHSIASTFINGNGIILEVRNDDDRNIYLVHDPNNWNGNKEGLEIVGHTATPTSLKKHIGANLFTEKVATHIFDEAEKLEIDAQYWMSFSQVETIAELKKNRDQLVKLKKELEIKANQLARADLQERMVEELLQNRHNVFRNITELAVIKALIELLSRSIPEKTIVTPTNADNFVVPEGRADQVKQFYSEQFYEIKRAYEDLISQYDKAIYLQKTNR